MRNNNSVSQTIFFDHIFFNSTVFDTTTGAKQAIQITPRTMKLTTTLRFLAALLLTDESYAVNVRSTSQRMLALPVIAGFEPSSDVTDLVCKSLFHIAKALRELTLLFLFLLRSVSVESY